MRLIILWLIVVSAFGKKQDKFKDKLFPRRLRKRNIMNFKRQLKNVVQLKRWKEENDLSDSVCFIHIPRTGGLSFKKSTESLNITLDYWHSAASQPSTRCGCITNLRDPVKRYISEWKFYGMDYFANKEKLFGWFPVNGAPESFDDYVEDTSTHNSMTKVLSGCQMFSECQVDSHDVDKIVDRVVNDCLTVLRTESMPVHGHKAEYNDTDASWKSKAYEANLVDVELYERLINLQ